MASFRIISILAAVVLLLHGPVDAGKKGQKMLLLHLRKTETGIELVKSKVYNGKKRHRAADENAAGILYEITAADGQVLFEGAIPENVTVYYDYADPGDPEKLAGGKIEKDHADFIVRIPWSKGMKNMAFFEQGGETGGKNGASTDGKAREKGKRITTIELPGQGGEQ